MTLKLEISPELEQRVRADAAARRVPVETLAAVALEAFVDKSNSGAVSDDEATRLASIDAGFGMFADRGRSVDDFLAERHAEGEADCLKWQQNQQERADKRADS